MTFPHELSLKLTTRRQNNSFRNLSVSKGLIDFSSNDYLGFSKNVSIYKQAEQILSKEKFLNGSTGSRLVSGTHVLQGKIETYLAKYHNSEAALLYNSGYDANLGLFSSILQKGATVLYDELIHASIRDGIRLSNAKALKFKHNSLEDLENKLTKCTGTVFIAVESVYSMDGDMAPLEALVAFSKKHNCYLIVDEAHSTGVYGKKGEGILQELTLEKDVFARIHTFGKAMGCHGAVVLGSRELRDYLINFSRPFIYTTAASLHSVATIQACYLELEKTLEIETLQSNITFFNNKVVDYELDKFFIKSISAIQCCVLKGNEKVKSISKKIKEEGFDVKAILSPTVPEGQERLRICLHSYNSLEEIDKLLRLLVTFVTI